MNLPWATPFQLQLSFEEPIRRIEESAAKGDLRAQALLKEIEAYPELRTGIPDMDGI